MQGKDTKWFGAWLAAWGKPYLAPAGLKQLRDKCPAEQTDLFLLENMRRVRFELEDMFSDLVTQIGGGGTEDAAGGLQLAQCPPGCRCAR